MIFVSTGTLHLPFDRMLTMVSHLRETCCLSEPIIIQTGTSHIQVPQATHIPFMTNPNMVNYISQARVVISAAGPATIFQIIQHNANIPLVIPRLKHYGEHVSDHQLHFGNYLSDRKIISLIHDEAELFTQFALNRKTKGRVEIFPHRKKLIQQLNQYLSEK